MSGLFGLLLDELDSSVLGTAGIGGVVGDGFVRALTHGKPWASAVVTKATTITNINTILFIMRLRLVDK